MRVMTMILRAHVVLVCRFWKRWTMTLSHGVCSLRHASNTSREPPKNNSRPTASNWTINYITYLYICSTSPIRLWMQY